MEHGEWGGFIDGLLKFEQDKKERQRVNAAAILLLKANGVSPSANPMVLLGLGQPMRAFS